MLRLRAAKEQACRLLYVDDDFAKTISRVRCDGRAATRTVSEVCGIDRVVYDATSEPPGAIEGV